MKDLSHGLKALHLHTRRRHPEYPFRNRPIYISVLYPFNLGPIYLRGRCKYIPCQMIIRSYNTIHRRIILPLYAFNCIYILPFSWIITFQLLSYQYISMAGKACIWFDHIVLNYFICITLNQFELLNSWIPILPKLWIW